MTDLGIGRLSATVTARADDPDLGPRVHRMLNRVAGSRLNQALGAVTFPDGHWCIRRIDIGLPVDPGLPDPAIETQWAAALADAVRAALSSGSDNVIHFRRVPDALTDLVASLALRRAEHAWAWTQAGIIGPSDPPPGSAPTDAALTALHRNPECALIAVIGAVRVAGLAAMHQLLGMRGWSQLATDVSAAMGGPPAPTARASPRETTGQPRPPADSLAMPDASTGGTPARETASRRPDHASTGGTPARQTDSGRPDHASTGPPPPVPSHHAVVAMAAALASRSTLAEQFRRSRVHPDPVTARAWAVLAAAQADPSVLRRAATPAILDELSALLAGHPSLPQPSTTRAQPARGAQASPHTPANRSKTPGPAQPEAGHKPILPRSPNSAPQAHPAPRSGEAGTGEHGDRTGWPTPWAGLLFLLSTAEEAGVPADLLTDPALASRPLWWVLHALATRLVPAAPDDPAVLAFAGLPPAETPQEQEPDRGEAAHLGRHAQRWALVTAARLRQPAAEDPFQVVTGLALRRGEILAEPGWVEVHLGFDQVDVDVRRAALDVDPGWVPWLGMVVRFVYE